MIEANAIVLSFGLCPACAQGEKKVEAACRSEGCKSAPAWEHGLMGQVRDREHSLCLCVSLLESLHLIELDRLFMYGIT